MNELAPMPKNDPDFCVNIKEWRLPWLNRKRL